MQQKSNSATVLVTYDCPFERAELSVRFYSTYQHYKDEASIRYQPSRSAISKGKGELTIQAIGTGGVTQWLLARLLNTSEQCDRKIKNFLSWPDKSAKDPGEYNLDDCVIWRIANYRKEWPA